MLIHSLILGRGGAAIDGAAAPAVGGGLAHGCWLSSVCQNSFVLRETNLVLYSAGKLRL